MKVVSIDLETAGLDPDKHSILEIAAVSFDTLDKEDYRCFRALVIPDNKKLQFTTDPYCAVLHARLWKDFLTFQSKKCEPQMISYNNNTSQMGEVYQRDLGSRLASWLHHDCGYAFEENQSIKITAAGKNFGSFDMRFLRRLPSFAPCVDIRHRILDVASHFLQHHDQQLPDTNLCCERAGIHKQTDHSALADALIVRDLCLKVFAK